jgi:TRAP-type C4-dicarboxylate transport system permease small subunit
MNGPAATAPTGALNPSPSRLAPIVRALQGTTQALSVGMLAVYFVLVLLQIFFRFVLNESLFWAEELIRGLMVWGVMLASVLVGRARGHIRVEGVELLVGEGARRVLYRVCDLISVAFCVLLVVASWMLMDRVWHQMSPMLEVPKWTVYMALAVGPSLEALVVLMTWGHGPAVDAGLGEAS